MNRQCWDKPGRKFKCKEMAALYLGRRHPKECGLCDCAVRIQIGAGTSPKQRLPHHQSEENAGAQAGY